jgi:hypothetical protein
MDEFSGFSQLLMVELNHLDAQASSEAVRSKPQ